MSGKRGSGRRVCRPLTEIELAARRIARQCRHVIQGVLREEEVIDVDVEFEEIALKELAALVAVKGER